MPDSSSIRIECVPFDGLRNKWKAEARVYTIHSGSEWFNWTHITKYGKTSEEAIRRCKKRLCKVVKKEAAAAKVDSEWRAQFQYATFDKDRDCSR